MNKPYAELNLYYGVCSAGNLPEEWFKKGSPNWIQALKKINESLDPSYPWTKVTIGTQTLSHNEKELEKLEKYINSNFKSERLVTPIHSAHGVIAFGYNNLIEGYKKGDESELVKKLIKSNIILENIKTKILGREVEFLKKIDKDEAEKKFQEGIYSIWKDHLKFFE